MSQKILFFLFLFFGCEVSQSSNLGIENFKGYLLNGNLVTLQSLTYPRVVLNVYSPTCVPCYKEIPTLNLIHQELEKTRFGKLYIAIDPYLILENVGNHNEETIYQEAAKIMLEEVRKRNIQADVLIMKPPFQVTPRGGLITGTPETLLFKTNPLRLYYNFIGSISEKTNPEEIQNDSRYKFFMKILGGI